MPTEIYNPSLLQVAGQNWLTMLGFVVLVVAAVAVALLLPTPPAYKLAGFCVLLVAAGLLVYPLIPSVKGPGSSAEDWVAWLKGEWCGPAGTGQTWTVVDAGRDRIRTKADRETGWSEWNVSVSAKVPETVTLANANSPGDSIR